MVDPRLPVRETANVFAWFTRLGEPGTGQIAVADGPLRDAYAKLTELGVGAAQRMHLVPTSRSRLR